MLAPTTWPFCWFRNSVTDFQQTLKVPIKIVLRNIVVIFAKILSVTAEKVNSDLPASQIRKIIQNAIAANGAISEQIAALNPP